MLSLPVGTSQKFRDIMEMVYRVVKERPGSREGVTEFRRKKANEIAKERGVTYYTISNTWHRELLGYNGAGSLDRLIWKLWENDDIELLEALDRDARARRDRVDLDAVGAFYGMLNEDWKRFKGKQLKLDVE